MQFIDLKKQYGLIEDKVQKRINDVLNHGQYIMGPEVRELEQQLANYLNVGYAINVSSGTDALLLALMALDIKAGDEVITTDLSFFATAEVICLVGATPVFVDIEEDTFNIDVTKIKDAITDKTKAIMPVSLYGQCANMTEINAIANAHNLAVIEDAAQSFGAIYQGQKSGAISTIGATSFFPSKPLGGYGDSGACFTNDEHLANKLKALLTHGQYKRYEHAHIGLNARMDSIQAAILIEKLAIFEEEKKLRQQVASRYHELLDGVVTLQKTPEDRDSVYAQFTIRVQNREKVQNILKEQGIPTAIHYPMPLHLQPALSYLNIDNDAFPVTSKAAKEVISLPMHPYLEEASQVKIATALQQAIEESQ